MKKTIEYDIVCPNCRNRPCECLYPKGFDFTKLDKPDSFDKWIVPLFVLFCFFCGFIIGLTIFK